MYNTIFSDLDGTLLANNHLYTQKTKDIITKLVKSGINFVVASGRHHSDIKAIFDDMGILVNKLSINGAMVANENNTVTWSKIVPPEIAKEVIAMKMPDPSVSFNCYATNDWLSDRDMSGSMEYHKYGHFSYQVINKNDMPNTEIGKFFFLGKTELLKQLEQNLINTFKDEVSLTYSNPGCLELMAKGVNKGTAAIAFMEQRGIDPQSAIAFGDGLNDIEMISCVGHGVVMENAFPEVKKALPNFPVAKSNNEDGLALYLEKIFF